jgi:hypothetical protein
MQRLPHGSYEHYRVLENNSHQGRMVPGDAVIVHCQLVQCVVRIILSPFAESKPAKNSSTCKPVITHHNQQISPGVDIVPHFWCERVSALGHVFPAFDLGKFTALMSGAILKESICLRFSWSKKRPRNLATYVR